MSTTANPVTALRSRLRRWRASFKLTRRGLRTALGLLWIADGALQLQPSMFGRGFVTDILAPAAQGQPGPIGRSVLAMAHFIEPHVALWNALFATVQVLIGVGLLFRPTVKPALLASFAWSLLVWWFGEGFGGLLTGGASALTGAPGSVVLYGLVGLLVWPAKGPESRSAAGAGLLGQRGARLAWTGLWLLFCGLSLQHSQLHLGDLLKDIAGAEPGKLASIDRELARWVSGRDPAFALGLAALEGLIGVAVLGPWRREPFLALGMTLALAFWVLGQGFGGIWTGSGTDPNSGPLLILVALVLWAASPRSRGRASTEGARRHERGRDRTMTKGDAGA